MDVGSGPRMTDVMFAITKATCQLRQKVSEGRTWMSFLVLLESVGMGLMDTAEEKQSICDSIHSIPPKWYRPIGTECWTSISDCQAFFSAPSRPFSGGTDGKYLPNPEEIHAVAVMCDDHKPIKFRPGQLFDPVKTILEE